MDEERKELQSGVSDAFEKLTFKALMSVRLEFVSFNVLLYQPDQFQMYGKALSLACHTFMSCITDGSAPLNGKARLANTERDVSCSECGLYDFTVGALKTDSTLSNRIQYSPSRFLWKAVPATWSVMAKSSIAEMSPFCFAERLNEKNRRI
ncbi:hypothetical protein F2P81_014288 [Scophthalmus maximus]|uniref:Uncharacterized protein n=1 Tax=Scophthalmus maximus TaxID=52904 RepID=A0A6A4SVV9_SCOMX|nr:hypothetical protein F2P81_014288 [Scophthalmus maximus]